MVEPLGLDNMLLSIITINYKTFTKTMECVLSVFDNYKNECENKLVEHIIIDNFSNDGSLEKLESEIKKRDFKHLVFYKNKSNDGFGKGCNLGANLAKGKYLMFLNSDTQVLDKGFLEMINFLEKNSKIGIIGGHLKNFDMSDQLSASKFYTIPNLFLLLLGAGCLSFLKLNPKKASSVDWVSGGCMMVRKDLFFKLKGFDPEIFMYGEDMEICFRAKQLGFETWYYPDALIKHASQGSSNRTFAIVNIYKGIAIFYKKHFPQNYNLAIFCLKSKAFFLKKFAKILNNNYLHETYEKAFKAI